MIISEKKKKIIRPEDVYNLIFPMLEKEYFVDKDKEHFWVIGLNTKNVSQYIELVALGGLNACPVSPREIFRLAIIKAVAGIVAVHNHPSGDPEPSEEDILMTKRLVEAGKLLGIVVMDFIIISHSHSGSSNSEPLIANPGAESYTIEDPEDSENPENPENSKNSKNSKKPNFFSARGNNLI